MFLLISSKDKDVVDVTDDPRYSFKDVSHLLVKNLWSRADTKWQAFVTVSPERSDEGG